MAVEVTNRSLVAIDRRVLRASMAAAAQRLADMLRLSPDTASQVADRGWGIGEHAAHVFMAQRHFASVVDGAAWHYPGNEPALEHFGERDTRVLAEGIVSQTEALLEATRRNVGKLRVHRWFGPMTMLEWESYALVHLQMHAVPVARALGVPCPVEPIDMHLAMPFLAIVVPTLSRAAAVGGRQGRLEIRLAGSAPFCIRFRKQGATIEAPRQGRVDCTIRTDAVTFFLVTFGMVPQDQAMREGLLRVSGPRHELGMTYKSRLPNP
jgi:hypothetical protein